MSYTPINWQTGDTITAEKMNKMDNGWSVETTISQLLSETVTTTTDQDELISGTLVYATQITADSIVVTFNGTDYTVAKQEPFEGATGYGTFSEQGPLFTTYPFCIMSLEEGTNQLYTETAGSYAVAVGTPSTTAEISADFEIAVSKANTYLITDTIGTLDKTYAEIEHAFLSGKTCIVERSSEYNLVISIGVLSVYVRGNYYTASSEDSYPVYH